MEADSHSHQGTNIHLLIGSGTLEFPAEQIAAIDSQPVRVLVPAVLASSLQEQKPEAALLEAAMAGGIDAAFVRSVAQVESGLRQTSVSRKGAIGLMQLMPATAKDLNVDPSHLADNARGGVQYLRTLLLRYRGDSALALAAYNAGPGAVERFRGIPPYLETQRYVVAVLKEYNRRVLQDRPRPKNLLAQTAKPGKPVSKPTATD